MRRFLLIAILGVGVGCQSSQPTESKDPEAERVKAQADRIEQGSEQPTLASRDRSSDPAGQRTESDLERTHNARTFYLLGVRYLSEDRPRINDAAREFQHALAEDPLFYKAHFKLGYTYYHRGMYQEEIAEYRKCLSINERYLPALINLGHALLAQDELEKAREAYEGALQVEPSNPTARYNLGLIAFDLRQWDESAKHLTAFLKSGQAETEGKMGDQARTCLDRIQQSRGEN
jgi:tetratricopeptide (TPR) repeat protein